jgi:hypothetical protein
VSGLFPKRLPVQLNTISEQLLNVLKVHRVFIFLRVVPVLAACRSTRVRIFRSRGQDQAVTTHKITRIWVQFKINRNIR